MRCSITLSFFARRDQITYGTVAKGNQLPFLPLCAIRYLSVSSSRPVHNHTTFSNLVRRYRRSGYCEEFLVHNSLEAIKKYILCKPLNKIQGKISSYSKTLINSSYIGTNSYFSTVINNKYSRTVSATDHVHYTYPCFPYRNIDTLST
jgi:hypothetical protein